MPDVQPTSNGVRIGVAQLAVTTNIEENVAKICTFLRCAQQEGVQLLCFPEYSLNPVLDHWVDLTPALAQIQQACRAYGRWCIVGAEGGTQDQRTNRVYLISPTGAIHYHYDKVHLWQSEREYFAAGETTQVVELDLLGVDGALHSCKIGLICCWDIAFPGFVAGLAQAGADLIFCPSYLCDYLPDQEALRALPLARAFENGVYVALCDAFTPATLSESVLCHPQRVEQRISQQEGMITSVVDPAALAALRRYYGYPTRSEA
jgi:predicted amidohydrolase